MKNNLLENITGIELESIQESLLVTSARNLKHAVYDEKGKQEVAKYVSTAVSKFKPSFPIFSESMVYP